jgi:hypothetical protein
MTWHRRKAACVSPLLFRAALPLREPRMPRGAATPGDFGPLQAPPALRRNPRQALAPDPLLRELAQCYLPVQRARAQDRLLPYPPGFVPPSLSGIQEAASWPVRIRHLRFNPRRRPGSRFRRPERPRLSQARRKVDRFLASERGGRRFPRAIHAGSVEKAGIPGRKSPTYDASIAKTHLLRTELERYID